VESIHEQVVDFPVEVIVVDNSCSDENAQRLREMAKRFLGVKLHINERNVGYISGNNRGAKEANGKYLLIVNPDIVWRKKDTLQKLVDYMERHPEVGVMGPRQINDDDGSTAMTVRAFPNFFLQVARRTFLRRLPVVRRWVAHDEMRHLDYTKEQEVDWLQSSFWVVRRELWDALGGLCTDYFLFMSDPDFCRQCWKKDFKVMYWPGATVYADGIRLSQGGFGAFFKNWTLRQHVRDSLKYVRRWRGK
jgi:GT2 family glycosyltransferase